MYWTRPKLLQSKCNPCFWALAYLKKHVTAYVTVLIAAENMLTSNQQTNNFRRTCRIPGLSWMSCWFTSISTVGHFTPLADFSMDPHMPMPGHWHLVLEENGMDTWGTLRVRHKNLENMEGLQRTDKDNSYETQNSKLSFCFFRTKTAWYHRTFRTKTDQNSKEKHHWLKMSSTYYSFSAGVYKILWKGRNFDNLTSARMPASSKLLSENANVWPHGNYEDRWRSCFQCVSHNCSWSFNNQRLHIWMVRNSLSPGLKPPLGWSWIRPAEDSCAAASTSHPQCTATWSLEKIW